MGGAGAVVMDPPPPRKRGHMDEMGSADGMSTRAANVSTSNHRGGKRLLAVGSKSLNKRHTPRLPCSTSSRALKCLPAMDLPHHVCLQKVDGLTATVQAACHNSQARAFNSRGQGRANDPLRPLQAESGPKVGTAPPSTGEAARARQAVKGGKRWLQLLMYLQWQGGAKCALWFGSMSPSCCREWGRQTLVWLVAYAVSALDLLLGVLFGAWAFDPQPASKPLKQPSTASEFFSVHKCTQLITFMNAKSRNGAMPDIRAIFYHSCAGSSRQRNHYGAQFPATVGEAQKLDSLQLAALSEFYNVPFPDYAAFAFFIGCA
eukprot:scaffold126160_cov21-Tisochrysis_lutea.AAC.1